jgi:hypothetical protein
MIQGYALAKQNAAEGLIANTAGGIGSNADSFARVGLRDWLKSEGIAEEPGEIQVNCRLYNPAYSSSYRAPDVYILGSQTILDGCISFKNWVVRKLSNLENSVVPREPQSSHRRAYARVPTGLYVEEL